MAPAAVPELDPTLRSFAESLDPLQQPKRFRCAACQQFNINPWKLECCSQNICESCHKQRSDHCPACEHKPLTDDLCKPAISLRNSIKKHLKDEMAKREPKITTLAGSDAAKTDIENPVVSAASTQAIIEESRSSQAEQDLEGDAAHTVPVAPTLSNGHVEEGGSATEPRPSLNNVESEEHPQPLSTMDVDPDEEDDDDDDVVIQVDMAEDDETYDDRQQQIFEEVDDGLQRPKTQTPPEKREQEVSDMSNSTFSNVSNMPFGSMDMNMMQQMMTNFNPMMAMQMGMNPMFSGFGGQNGGMNGMNMNMGVGFPNQGMFPSWNNQNNNMWQSNNPNAFPNTMNGDFGSNYGYNTSQQGYKQQYSNDYQPGHYGRGYGRGRGRGRGGYGRGRGNFNQFQNNHQAGFQNSQDRQQYNARDVQQSMANGQERDDMKKEEPTYADDDTMDDEFAPGGQDEVKEALGDDYDKSTPGLTPPATNGINNSTHEEDSNAQVQQSIEQSQEPTNHVISDLQNALEDEKMPETSTVQETSVVPVESLLNEESNAPVIKPIPEAYREDLDVPMAPPSAPLGPSAKYGDSKDFGFRSRGHGRYASRGRASISLQNGHSPSPVTPVAQTSEPRGVGVVGAPTGPRAMREPREPPSQPIRKPSITSPNGGGFQIVGRASMQKSEVPTPDRLVSAGLAQANGYDNYEDNHRSSSRRRSRNEKYDDYKYDGRQDDYDRDYDQDRKRKRTRRDEHGDYEMGDEEPYSRSDSPDYKHRSRHDKEKDTYSRHHSSRKSKRKYEDEHDEIEANGYGDSGKEVYESERSDRKAHRSSGKSSSKYDDRDREDRHRDKERKRSRHDRVQEADGVDEEEDFRSSRSRRHKKDHRREEQPAAQSTDIKVNGRSSSHRNSGASTPVDVPKKDPYAEEREKANAKRMEKEGQKNTSARSKPVRETNFKGASRRVSYKYEDEVERDMGKREPRRW